MTNTIPWAGTQFEDEYQMLAAAISRERRRAEAAEVEAHTLKEAVRELYFAARWTADRPVDAAAQWEAVRDAAGIAPGSATRSGVGATPEAAVTSAASAAEGSP